MVINMVVVVIIEVMVVLMMHRYLDDDSNNNDDDDDKWRWQCMIAFMMLICDDDNYDDGEVYVDERYAILLIMKDNLLREAVEMYGNEWKKVAAHVGGTANRTK